MRPALAVHGGAGVLRADKPGARHRAVLKQALAAGYELLVDGKPALDAVAAAVVVLEDSPLFNAGRGSSFNSDGEIEMDASIMDGATLRAGAVATVRRIRNPILAARAVMEKTRHVLLAGSGAERFARSQGLKLERPEYFRTARRLSALRKNRKQLSRHGRRGGARRGWQSRGGDVDRRLYGETSGPRRRLADHRRRHLRRQPRLRDLGDGPGRSVHPRRRRARCLRPDALQRSASLAARGARRFENVANLGGDGGLIALDRRGNVAMPFNSQGMFRACIDRHGRRSSRSSDYSSFTFASFTTLSQRARSARTCAAELLRVLPTGSMPSVA